MIFHTKIKFIDTNMCTYVRWGLKLKMFNEQKKLIIRKYVL